MTLETAVGSRKSRQAIGAPSKTEKLLITNKVITSFSISLCTPISYLSFSRSTAVSRMTSTLLDIANKIDATLATLRTVCSHESCDLATVSTSLIMG